MQGRARRGTQRVQGERGTLALTLTLLALDLAVLFRVLLHFDVAITGGIARRAAAAGRETRWYGAGRREAQFHYVWEFAIWKRRGGWGIIRDNQTSHSLFKLFILRNESSKIYLYE